MSATVLDMSMSLDGFIAGPNEGPDNGLGDGGHRLHEWAMTGGDVDLEAMRRSGGVNGKIIDELPVRRPRPRADRAGANEDPRGGERRDPHALSRPALRPASSQATQGAVIGPGHAVAPAGGRLSHPWKAERSPASQASRSPGMLRSQSGRISRVAPRRSCQRSTTEGRPQNQ